MPAAPRARANAPSRRNHSQQRERVLGWLRGSDSHPTAAQIHQGLQRELPSLSIGTVYRNLEVLVDEGLVDEVARAGGPARYDANLTPHHHFSCDRCRRIVDVEVPIPRGLARRLEGEHGLQARRIRISFYGVCTECEADSNAKPAAAPA